MVLEKWIYRLCDCFKDKKKEEFDELDYDLKLDGTFRLEGSLIPAGFSGFPSGTLNLLFVQSTPKGVTCS